MCFVFLKNLPAALTDHMHKLLTTDKLFFVKELKCAKHEATISS